MYDWGDRSLPVTARLRSKFFITFGGPQGHATPLKKMSKQLRLFPLPSGHGSVTVEVLHRLGGSRSRLGMEWAL
jgi:hypothetical protein